MSTPEDKLHTAADKVSAEIAKVKSLWSRWEPYAIGVLGFVLGFIACHILHR